MRLGSTTLLRIDTDGVPTFALVYGADDAVLGGPGVAKQCPECRRDVGTEGPNGPCVFCLARHVHEELGLLVKLAD